MQQHFASVFVWKCPATNKDCKVKEQTNIKKIEVCKVKEQTNKEKRIIRGHDMCDTIGSNICNNISTQSWIRKENMKTST